MKKKVVAVCALIALIVVALVLSLRSTPPPLSTPSPTSTPPPLNTPPAFKFAVAETDGDSTIELLWEGAVGVGYDLDDLGLNPDENPVFDVFLMYQTEIRLGDTVMFSETIDTGQNPPTDLGHVVWTDIYYVWPGIPGERWDRVYWEARTAIACDLVYSFAHEQFCGGCKFCFNDTSGLEVKDWWVHRFDYGSYFFLPIKMK